MGKQILIAIPRQIGCALFFSQLGELGAPGFLVLWRENQPNLFMREKQQPFSQALETLETPKRIVMAKLCRALRGQPDEVAQRGGWTEVHCPLQLVQDRLAPAHVVEPRRVGGAVRDKFHWRLGPQDTNHQRRQIADADFFGAPDIEHLAARRRTVLEAHYRFDSVPDIAETARLGAIAKNPERLAGLGGGDKPRQHHAVASS